MEVIQNLKSIQKRIKKAALRADRDHKRIRIVAVTKNVKPEKIVQAAMAGVDNFGESYAQELRDKHVLVEKSLGRKVNWHFIGRIQRNKVKYVVGSVELIHSLDSIKVAEEMNNRADRLGINVPILIEVNAGEKFKGGVKFEGVPEFLGELRRLPHLNVEGLMIMPPYFDDPEMARPHYKDLRELRDKLQKGHPGLIELSMGMSVDFEVAIEEGATIVRIGTAIFGSRAQ